MYEMNRLARGSPRTGPPVPGASRPFGPGRQLLAATALAGAGLMTAPFALAQAALSGTAANSATGTAQATVDTNCRNHLNGVAGAAALADLKVNQRDAQIDSNRRDANAGTAGAIALANLPQPRVPGKSMVSTGVGVGVGVYEGETSAAIGVSKRSDNGKWVMKLGGSATSRGKVGVGAGVGCPWQRTREVAPDRDGSGAAPDDERPLARPFSRR